MLLSQKNKSFEEFIQNKWIEPEALEKKAEEIRRGSQTIATLNGSFDLLHAGHLEIIYQASLQADILILALNTDESIKLYKSPLRPIVTLENRMKMVAALDFVDYVTCFSETDPRQMIKKVRPDVHVNGSEYGENCIEADAVREVGGRLHIVSLVPGLSTSSLIRKIVQVCG